MTERTTRIWVELTDEQMDQVETWQGLTGRVIAEAIVAQRPRPITVGDRVRWTDSMGVYLVVAIHNGWAGLWYPSDKTRPYRWVHLDSLTRVDDEATA